MVTLTLLVTITNIYASKLERGAYLLRECKAQETWIPQQMHLQISCLKIIAMIKTQKFHETILIWNANMAEW